MKYKWEVKFFIPIYLASSSKLKWKRNNVLLKSRSNYGIDGKIFIENDSNNEAIAKNEARELIKGFLDAYFVLNNQYLQILSIDANLMNKNELIRHKRRLMDSNDLSGSFVIPKVITPEMFDESFDFFEKIEGIKNDDERDRVKRVLRWFRRGLSDTDRVDNFISYWISFNAFYGYYKKPNDREYERFLKALEQNIELQIAENILNTEKNNIESLIRGNVVQKNRSGQITKKLSEDLENNLVNKTYEDALKDAVDCIYQVRCNVFHGDIQYTQLIDSCIPILNAVIRECLIKYIG